MDASSVALLTESSLFASMQETLIAECAEQFTVIHGRRRVRLYRQGDSCEQIYCVLRGSVRISRLAEDGAEFTTRIVGPTGIFGEEALFDDKTFSSTAAMLSDGILAVCSAARIRTLSARYPKLAINIAQYLHEEQNRTLDRLEQTVHKTVRERLLALLYQLATEYGAYDADGGKCAINLTHLEIASLIDSTRETVSCELGKLVNAGLVAKRGRRILVDPAPNEAA